MYYYNQDEQIIQIDFKNNDANLFFSILPDIDVLLLVLLFIVLPMTSLLLLVFVVQYNCLHHPTGLE
jgi:hypothetical protein